MGRIITLLDIILSVFLIFLVLVQARGTGFGRSFTSISFTRRGIERFVFKLTFVIAFSFIIISALRLYL